MSETEQPRPEAAKARQPSEYGAGGALRKFGANLLRTPEQLRASIFRHGAPVSERGKSQVVFSNFFLHVLPVRTHLHAIKAATTLGLGVATLVLFVVLCITGVLLMVYYKPSVELAYDSMLDIQSVVPNGRLIRNMHRWAAHAMVVCVMLHMARAFYTSAYKGPRRFNWVVGMGLFVLTLGLSFTGYLLPWDQLAFWAITVGAHIAASPQEVTDALGVTSVFDVGRLQKEVLLGAHHVGEEALIRFYVLHIVGLPLAAAVLMAVHVWRVRKDGGLARPRAADDPPPGATPSRSAGPAALKSYGLMALVKGSSAAVNKEPRNTLMTWPNVLYVVGAVSMVTVLAMVLLGVWVDAPLREIANPSVPENPAKAPWYFLGLQELVSYSAFMGGIGIPAIVVLGLALVPYLDREEEDVGIWFSGPAGRRVALHSAILSAAVVVGMLWFTVRLGWLRDWEATAHVPQLVITALNPGTLLVAAFAGWSLWVMHRKGSTRLGAIALFTCFLVGFVILTYFATVHRGPDWEFYRSQSDWPRR
jgi:quinol-cytochrome oxidoreductase complex cytochrome b subunit